MTIKIVLRPYRYYAITHFRKNEPDNSHCKPIQLQ